MENRDRQVLIKILNETDVITDILKGVSFEVFIVDEKTKRATCMTLINIGELVKNLSENFKQANIEIPWRAISGLRDVTAHRYQSLLMEDIWMTVQTDIPILRRQISSLL